jgi:hypothetical protein
MNNYLYAAFVVIALGFSLWWWTSVPCDFALKWTFTARDVPTRCL